MALTPNVVAATPITAAWGNEIRDRTCQNFATAAERASQWVTPAEGSLSWVRDVNAFSVYDGSAWVAVGTVLSGTWTPIWQGTSAVATGVTVRGNYYRVGSLVTLTGSMTFGAGSAVGTGLQMGGLPWRIKSANTTQTVGTGFCTNTNGSPPEEWQVHVKGAAGATVVNLRVPSLFGVPGYPQAVPVAAGIPFTWVTGCIAGISFTYETDQ